MRRRSAVVACVATSIAVAIQVTGRCLNIVAVETPPPAVWDLDSPAGYGQTVRMWTMLKLAPKAIQVTAHGLGIHTRRRIRQR